MFLWKSLTHVQKFRQISLVVYSNSVALLFLLLNFFLFLESQLVWPTWRKFSTVNLQSNQIYEYIRKIFSKKFENSPKNEPWIIYGIQGIDGSYVSGDKCHFSVIQIQLFIIVSVEIELFIFIMGL